jgi:hypothetical protein
MTTRISKISRLPFKIREELNLRLLNGELGAPLLDWLNELPESKEILAKLFAGQRITKQNLSEWRHRGYEDWLRHRHRQEQFQQMNEQGAELLEDERTHDSFENFARLLLADLIETLNDAHKIADANKRWQRLREVSRDLARLQHGYNHSRRVELSFKKWNHEMGCDEPGPEAPPASSPQPGSASLSVEASAKSDVPPASPSSESDSTVQASPTESRQKNPALAPRTIRTIYQRRCGYGCICKDCHPDDGEYPYAQAVKDHEHHRDQEYCHQQNAIFVNADCDCYCGCAKSVAWEQRTPGQFPHAAVPGAK